MKPASGLTRKFTQCATSSGVQNFFTWARRAGVSAKPLEAPVAPATGNRQAVILHRYHIQQLRSLLFRQSIDNHRAEYITGRDPIARHALIYVLTSHREGEGRHRALRGGVCHARREPAQLSCPAGNKCMMTQPVVTASRPALRAY